MGAKSVSLPNNEKLIRSRARVADHGEVFTPSWLVEDMLDLVKAETERIDSRFLEPACGSGNFLVPILRRKLAAVDLKYGKSEFDRRMFALLALMCIYGIELLEDNVRECREILLDVFAAHLSLDKDDDLYRAAANVLKINIVHGDAWKMKVHDGSAITFAEWGYIGKGKFQRRDFLFESLSQSYRYRKRSSTEATGSLFADPSKDPLFQGTAYPPMSVMQLAGVDDT